MPTNDPFHKVSAYPDTERSVAAPFSGSDQLLGGPLTVNPVIAIFDNQSSVDVELYWNGVLFKTFTAGEVFVLDLKANNGMASTFCIPLNTQFSVVGTGGTGGFYMSVIYAG